MPSTVQETNFCLPGCSSMHVFLTGDTIGKIVISKCKRTKLHQLLRNLVYQYNTENKIAADC